MCLGPVQILCPRTISGAPLKLFYVCFVVKAKQMQESDELSSPNKHLHVSLFAFVVQRQTISHDLFLDIEKKRVADPVVRLHSCV